MRGCAFARLALLMPVAASGQDGGTGVVGAIAACRSIADSTARLDCFDKAAAALASAQDKKEVVVLDRTEVKKTRRSLFGFNVPKIPFLSDADDKDTTDAEIETTFASVRSLGHGKWAFRTAEDAQWQTTDPMLFEIKAGEKVTIRRAALGSYFIKVAGQRPARAVRVN